MESGIAGRGAGGADRADVLESARRAAVCSPHAIDAKHSVSAQALTRARL
jgi:hypothetical protein